MPIKKISSDGTGDWVTAVENPDGTGSMGYAAMSPDGTQICYLYYTDTNVELHKVNIDGTDDTVITYLRPSPDTPSPYAWQNVAWGTRYIAINVDGSDNGDLGPDTSNYGNTRNVVIRLVDADGNPPPEGDAVPFIEFPTWSNGQTSVQARLTSDDQVNEVDTPHGDYENMCWSPSGQYLYVETFRRRSAATNEGGQCIIRIDIEDFTGHNPAIILDGPVPDVPNGYVNYEWPALDPTGTTLCVTKRTYPYGGGGYSYSLVLADYDGSNETLLLNDAAWAVWSGDGTRILAYATDPDNYYAPIVIDVATSAVTHISSDTDSYGSFGFLPGGSPAAENPFTMPNPTPLTNKVWYYNDSDNLVHSVNPNDTGDVLRDPRTAPNHVWIGWGYPWSISPSGKYVYFVDADHANIHKVFKSWVDCTHYRYIWGSPAFISVPTDAMQVSWDDSQLLISVSNGEAYAWCGANGEDLGAPFNTSISVQQGNPYTVLPSGWTLLYAGSSMQCLYLGGTSPQALIWNQSNGWYGMIDLITNSITNWTQGLGWVTDMIAPAVSVNNQLAHIEGATGDIVVRNMTSGLPVLYRWHTTPTGSLNYVVMWNPAGTELIVDDNAGAIKRYTASGTLLNTLSTITPSRPMGWT